MIYGAEMNIGKCEACGNTAFLTKDHKIPLKFFKIAAYYQVELPFYSEDAQNMQELCKMCNRAKGMKLEGELGDTFLKLLRAAMDDFRAKGGYIPAKHILNLRRLRPISKEIAQKTFSNA